MGFAGLFADEMLNRDGNLYTDHLPAANLSALLHEKWGVGPWIWAPQTKDKQTCRLWRAFDIPKGSEVSSAKLRIAVDNGYRLMLDGREIGMGSDWRCITEYDVSGWLQPGRHVVAVEGFNDNREAGMLFGLQVNLGSKKTIRIASDADWRYVPGNEPGWESRRSQMPGWGNAVVVSTFLPRQGIWHERQPTMILNVVVPPPTGQRFWQSTWFQMGMWCSVALAGLLCLRLMARLAVQSKAQELLSRERARIARDIHDELGARMTELALEGEVIRTELPDGLPVLPKLDALCEKARSVSGAMDEVVWMVNSKRDTLSDFTNFACKHAQRFLEPTPIRCRLDVDADLPEAAFELPVRRSLLLGVKEALNNAVKYSNATELFLRIHRNGQSLNVVVEDNGSGFDLETADPVRNGLTNMNERMKEVGGSCQISTRPGEGCRVEFQVPLPKSTGRPAPALSRIDLQLAGGRRETAISTAMPDGGEFSSR